MKIAQSHQVTSERSCVAQTKNNLSLRNSKCCSNTKRVLSGVLLNVHRYNYVSHVAISSVQHVSITDRYKLKMIALGDLSFIPNFVKIGQVVQNQRLRESWQILHVRPVLKGVGEIN
jgi:hypothetical protein